MKPINEKAPVVCRKTILIESKPEKIWNILADIENWPTWHNEISYTKVFGPIEPNVAFTWKMNGMKINSILHTVAPFYGLGWTGKAYGLLAIHNWLLKAVEGGTEVTVSESMQGILANVFRGKLLQNLERGMEHWLNLLKFESEKTEAIV